MNLVFKKFTLFFILIISSFLIDDVVGSSDVVVEDDANICDEGSLVGPYCTVSSPKSLSQVC